MFGSSNLLRRTSTKLVLSLASTLTLVVISGCGDDGLGARYPVTGTVTYKDQPIANGSISFYATGNNPESATRGASGVIKDGKYTLSTQGDSDGAFPGDYLVSITARDVDMTKANANASKSGGAVRQDDVAKAYATAKSLIPKKYEVPETGGLKAKVEAKSNTIDFKLTD